jgi:hypothetical protein
MRSTFLAVFRSMTIRGLQNGGERVPAAKKQGVSIHNRATLEI